MLLVGPAVFVAEGVVGFAEGCEVTDGGGAAVSVGDGVVEVGAGGRCPAPFERARVVCGEYGSSLPCGWATPGGAVVDG